MRRATKRLFAVLVALVVSGALLEIGQRTSDWLKYRARFQRPYSYRFETARGTPLAGAQAGRIAVTHHPYLIARTRPSQALGDVTINAQGFRGRDWTIARTPGTSRVMLLGGSTAFGHGASRDDRIVAALLEGLLRQRGPAEVLNAGTVGFDSGRELVLLATELLDYAPDVVLVLDAWNDFNVGGLTPPDRPLVHPTFEEFDAILEAGAVPNATVLHASAFFRSMAGKLADARKASARPAAAFGLFFDHPDALPRYEKNLLRLAQLSRAAGARVVLATQPELFQRADPVPEPEQQIRAKQARGYGDLARARYPGFAGAAARVAAATEASHVDLTNVFDGKPDVVFLDGCHLEDRGNELVAERLLPAVVAALAR